jgi:hypothetical protein
MEEAAMPVQARRRRVKVIGSAVLTLAAVAAVNPMTAVSAQADVNSPRVNLVVTASCARFADDSVPTAVTVSTQTNPETKSKSVETDNESATFGALRFRNIPSAGTKATATVTCEDPDGTDQQYSSKAFTVKRPAGTIVQKISIS